MLYKYSKTQNGRPNTPKDVIQIFSHVVQEMNVFPEICLRRLIAGI